jgi:hypothetical protein
VYQQTKDVVCHQEREREREITLFFREIILFFLGSAHVNTEKLPSEVPKDSF